MAGSGYVLPCYVGDLELARVAHARVMAIDALGHADRLPYILDPEIAVGDIGDGPASSTACVAIVGDIGGLALPGFDPGSVGRVDQVHVLVHYVPHNVWMGWILPDGANGHAVGAVTGDVPGDDVGAVAFDRDAVVSYNGEC